MCVMKNASKKPPQVRMSFSSALMHSTVVNLYRIFERHLYTESGIKQGYVSTAWRVKLGVSLRSSCAVMLIIQPWWQLCRTLILQMRKADLTVINTLGH